MSAGSLDSLFNDDEDDDLLSEDCTENEPDNEERIVPATREAPPIPGLYIFPSLLPEDVASGALRAISAADHFVGGTRDQVMLFTRPLSEGGSGLPPHIAALDATLGELLRDRLPENVHALAFGQDLARQAILNLYVPGEGITPHVDLPGRYADGIVGASLTGGCVMSFDNTAGGGQERRYDVYLPPRSVYVMSGPARWEWAHGIARRTEDVVLDGRGGESTVPRGLRLSVTLRWMKPGPGLLS